MNSSSRFIYLAGSLLGLVSLGFSQEKPQAPDRSVAIEHADVDSSATSVPKISLPEFEITGEEVIRLGRRSKPAVNDRWEVRSTTLGNPPGKRDGPVASLGKMEMAGLPGAAETFSGRTFAGFRTFRTPTLNLWLGASSRNVGLSLKSGYESSGGHVEYADYRKGYASLSANTGVGGRSFIPGDATLGGELGFDGDAYRLYGSVSPDMLRTRQMVRGKVSVSSELEETFSYDADFSLAHSSVSDTWKSKETDVGFRIAGEKRLEKTSIKGGFEWHRNFYGAPSTSQDPLLTGLNAEVRHLVAEDLQVNGGVKMFLLRGSTGGSSFRLFPVAGVSWYTKEWLVLSAQYSPFVDRMSLWSLFGRNPYVSNDVDLFHAEYHTNLELSADFQADRGLAGKLSFRYQRGRNVPIFAELYSSEEPDAVPTGVWDVNYSGVTTIFGVDAEISTSLFQNGEVLFSFAWRNVDNSFIGGPLPYAPAVQAGGMYRHSFSERITLQTDLNILGSQYTDFAAMESLPAFTLWDITGEYEAFDRAIIGLAVRNILDQDQERWRGYIGIPRTLELFGRYNW